MFRFAILVLAGIGLGALIFGGGPSATAGIGFLALIPIFFLFKILLIATFFGVFARRRFSGMKDEDTEHPWQWRGQPWQGGPRRRPRRKKNAQDSKPETDRFEEWHRMAHAKEEVAGWADEPE
jgi:hypothetical protein